MSEARLDNNAIPATPSPTIRNRLSLFLQLAPPGISKSKPQYPRRSLTPGKKSPRKETESGISSAVSRASDRPVLDGAASTASFADSLASAPHGSLLFKSQSTDVLLPAGLLPVPSDPIPPTTNELDAEEKMRLMKKVRKLSRVLGEYPLPVGLHDLPPTPDGQITSGEAYAGSVPTSPLSGVKGTQRKSFRHSWTVGYSTDFPAPSTPDPPSSPHTPTSPLEFAVLPGADRTSSVYTTPSRSHSFDVMTAHCDEPMGVESSTRPRRLSDGAGSISFPPERTPEQVQRARAARLTRHLGDDVPPEILFRAASPPPPRASSPFVHSVSEKANPRSVPPVPDPLPLPTLVLDSRTLPRRSSSLRRKRAPAGVSRRLSLDLKALQSVDSAGVGSRSSTSSGPKSSHKLEKPVKRSRSMWARKFSTEGPRADLEVLRNDTASPSRGSFDTPPKEPISEKERIMNVKRAKKMTQYFGDQPPSALFQITNFAQGVSDEEAHRLRRDSLATIISISSSVSVAHLDGRAVRDSYISMSSVISSSNSGGTPADGVTTVTTTAGLIIDCCEPSNSNEGTTVRDGEQGEETLAKAQYEFPLPPSTPPAVSTKFSGRSPPHSPPAGSTTVSVYHTPYHHEPSSPSTPPPFSDVISINPRSASKLHGSSSSLVNDISSDPSKTSLDFHMRQKRAAKLSKFFGVEMNTLAEVLPTNPRQSSPVDPRHTHINHVRVIDQHVVVSSDEVVPSAMVLESAALPVANSGARVEVSSEPGKGPLRFLHGQNARELDMNDAIEKLRRMKSV